MTRFRSGRPSRRPSQPRRGRTSRRAPGLEPGFGCRRSAGREQGGCRRRDRPADAGVGSVPDGPRQLGDERLDRHGRQGRRHDGERDPGRDHGLHARHGLSHDHGGQDRRADRPQARVRDRLRDLRMRLADDRACSEPAGAAARVVVPRGRRRGAHPARDRRARRVELPGRAADDARTGSSSPPARWRLPSGR